MRSVAVVAMVALCVAIAIPAVSHAEETARPDWCKKGWQCIPSAELVEDTLYKIDLREQLAIAQAKNRRTGWDIGCGVGIALVVDGSYNVNAPPAGFCGVTFAFWRFR